MSEAAGKLAKMRADYVEGEQVRYQLPLGETLVSLNPFIEKKIRLIFQDEIRCTHCDRQTKKSFGGGYCYPCFIGLAQCDMCVVKPELCHYDKGTCREPDWGETHCLIPHTVYLANTSKPKVGITRGEKPINRWIDQGAVEAIVLGTVANRKTSGKVELALKEHIADKTNWRAMLKNEIEPVDLVALRADLSAQVPKDIEWQPADSQAIAINYPVTEYPQKIKSHNFEKSPEVEGTLLGIKGQYLLFDTGVINIRKFTGYVVSFEG